MQDQDKKQIDQVDVFENDIALYLKLFCEEHNIQDMRQASQSVWNGALRYIRKHVFNNKSILKLSNNIYNNNSIMNSTYNMYNYDIVNDICDIYIDLCFVNDKEISAMGFYNLTGISNELISNWGNNDNKLSSKSYQIYKKLIDFNEESLSDKLATGNKNPVGIIAILNRRHGWASPYTSDSNRQKTVLTAAELPKLEQISNTDSIQAPLILESS